MNPVPRTVRRLSLWALLLGMVLPFAPRAQGASYPLTFYIPFPEADYLAGLDAINAAAVDPVYTYISIAAIADGTIIRYDHWEDGYDPAGDDEAPLQSTTQVWGDNNPGNGIPPGYAVDIVNAGSVILLTNQITTTSPSSSDYDARDRVAANRTISVTRTFWASGSSTLFAGCVETFDVSLWGLEYRVPIGENASDSAQMFEYTALSIMAAQDNTTVRVDANNNGTFETTNTFNRGETMYVNGGVNVGGRVVSDKPVQVVMLSGDVGSNYESRDSSLLPVSLWGTSYVTPVSTPAGDGTRVWLYNPSNTTLTVKYDWRVGSGSVTSNSIVVPANTCTNVLLPVTAGARFYTTNSPARVFYAYSTTDSDGAEGDNQAWDWSFTLFPENLLSPQIVVGLGIGQNPLVAQTENGNPVWVTPVGNGESNITVYVDYDGDNVGTLTDPNGFKYDISYSLKELQQQKIYDSDSNQTAMLIYVLSTNVKLVAAWGQDPTTATAGSPGLDVGTSIPPEDVLDVGKSLSVTNDADGDGQLSPSDRAEYLITIGNSSRAIIPAAIVVTDIVPADTTYVTNSTFYRTNSASGWVAVPDDTSGTAFPLDGAGLLINVNVQVTNYFYVRFQVDVDAYSNLDPGRESIVNTGSVRSVSYNRTLTFENDTPLRGSIGDRVWHDTDSDGVQDVGELGINGVVVYLDLNTNGVRDTGEPSSTTSGDGNYLLTGPQLIAGAYTVRVDIATLPSGFTATHDLDGVATSNRTAVTLLGGQDRTDVDFGYRIPPSPLRIVKTSGASAAGLAPGETNTYTLTISNTGIVTQTGIQITDILASSLTYASTSTVVVGYKGTDSATNTFRDEFDSQAYTNNNGTTNWTDNWTEVGESNGATTGNVDADNDGAGDRTYVLHIYRTGGDFTGGAYRQANLTGCTNAVLSFIYRRDDIEDADNVYVQASTSAGGTYTTLFTVPTLNGSADADYIASGNISLNSYTGAAVYIRFYAELNGTSDDNVWFDNIQITCVSGGVGAAQVTNDNTTGTYPDLLDGVPPDMVEAGDGFTLATGKTMTVTFRAVVTNPLPLGLANITNTGGVRSDQYPVWTYSTVYDPVKRAAIGDFTWIDTNGNGTQDVTEAVLSNVVVRLYDVNTNVIGTTTSDVNGAYAFTNVLPGTYSVGFAPPSGYLFTVANVGSDAADSDVPAGTNRTANYTLTSGQTNNTIDAGFYQDTDLGVLKDVNRSKVATNEYVWFTITLTNNGPQAATGIRLQDTWPATISYISHWASTGVYNSGVGIWSNFSLAVGAGATLVITGRVNTTQTYQFITNRIQIVYLDQRDTNPANDQDDAVIQTLVVLSRVEAFASGSDSWVEWETSSEIGTAGFNLYRINGDGVRVKVNGALVPAVVDAPQGGVYRLSDPGLRTGVAYAYAIEELEQDGKTRQYGPFEVIVTATTATAPVGDEGVARENQVVRVPAKVEEGMGGGFAAAAPMFAKSIMAFDSFVPPALQPLKLTVKAAGVYGVAASDVAALFGADPSFVAIAFATGSVRLSNRGRTIPLLSSKDGSVLYFHGEAIESPYTDANVYWLTWETGVTMATVDGTAGTGGGVTTFRDTIHFEVDRYGATAVVLDPEGDYWLWDYFVAGSATAGQRSFVLRADGAVPSSEQASLTVRLVSSTAAGRGRDHHVVVRLNGAVIGEDAWAGIATRNLKFTFDQSLLVAGDNTVEITSVLDPLVPYSIMYLDSFDLAYRRAHEAVGDRLTFRAGAAGAVAVGGFTVSEVRILDITDPAAPKSVSGVVAGPANGSNRAVFMAPDTTTVYTAFTPVSALPLASMAAVDASTDLRSGANEGRHVIVTVPALAAAAERLAEHRRSRGLSSKVVMLGDIYDQFGDGIATPYAIRAFLVHALKTWSQPPRYVVLAGEGSYDYKGIKKTGDCIVPPFMMATALSLFGTDAPYSDPDGDGTADLAVGRLPVATAAELDAVVDKIVGYETAPVEEWQTLATLSADVPDKGGDFTGSSEETAALVPPGWSQTKVHMAETSVTDARSRLIGRINEGTAFLNYFGHGGMDTLSGHGVLKTADVAELANGNRLPVVTAMSCVIGRFEIPGYDCLGEALILKTGGGAVAVWAPSGLTYNEPSAALGRTFYRMVLQQGEGVLGEAILRAKTEAAQDGCPAESLALYNLLGDPATVVAGFDATFGGGQAAGMSLGEWRRLAFGWTDRQDESLCGDLADPDGDGIANLAEYAFGRNPRQAETGSVFSLTGEAQDPLYDFEVCFTRNKQAPDVGVEVEISSDLITWYGGQGYVVATRITDDGNGQTETVHAMVRTPDPEKAKAFIRLRTWKR